MIEDDYDHRKLFTAENRTVVTNISKGIIQNRWSQIIKKFGAWFVPLTKIPFISYNEDLRLKFRH